MSKVIKLTPEDWYTLRMLQDSIKDMKARDSNRFKIAIDKEQSIYKNMIDELNAA